MKSFEELVAGAVAADVSGWGFGWLDGRATEERPPWGYARQLAARLSQVETALDIDTGGGEVVSEAPVLPPRMVVTEGWPPNVKRARTLLGPGVQVLAATGDSLPLPDVSFDLVSSRHPVKPNWAEIRRVLVPGGHYFAQHVGPASAFELIEFFLGLFPRRARAAVLIGRLPMLSGQALLLSHCERLVAGWSSSTSVQSSGFCASACGGFRTSLSTGTPRSCGGSTSNCATVIRWSPTRLGTSLTPDARVDGDAAYFDELSRSGRLRQTSPRQAGQSSLHLDMCD